MSTDKNDTPSNAKNIESDAQQIGQPGSYTEIGSAEFVVSGPNANINVNKASHQDFLAIYEHAFQKGHDRATSETITDREASRATSKITSGPERTSAFISYSRTDKKYLEELQAHLASYVRQGLISFWDDTMIKPGTKWFEEIKNGLQSAKVAVFLVSAEFLASDFIATNELPPLLAAANNEGAVILSVILRSCPFKYSALAQFQAVNAPSNPLSTMTRGKRDEVWFRVAESVKDALKL